jgi:hypothetical protein
MDEQVFLIRIKKALLRCLLPVNTSDYIEDGGVPGSFVMGCPYTQARKTLVNDYFVLHILSFICFMIQSYSGTPPLFVGSEKIFNFFKISFLGCFLEVF